MTFKQPKSSMRVLAATAARRGHGDRAGNVSVIFALALLPMIGLVGLGVDLSRSLSTKTVLDASADAAALSAATEAMSLIQQSGGSDSATATAIVDGQYAGKQVFASDSGRAAMLAAPVTPTVTLARNGQTITATVTYQATVNNAFGPIFGSPTSSLNGNAEATLTLPKYMNIYVAVDISQSMGIAATQSYMDQLSPLTGGCVFGCHVTQGSQTKSNEQVAHNNNIQLRIDIIRQATQNMIQTAQAVQNGTPMIGFALYTMQHQLVTVKPVTTDYAGLLTAANAFDLGPNDSSGVGDTEYPTTMPQLTSAVPASGTGASSSKPQTFVFLMTDGVQDIRGGCTDGHCTKAFDPATCASLKTNGVTVGVIYTTYLPFPNEQTYRDLVQPFADQIAPNLQACASPGWFYQATDASDIQAAVNALFAQATGRGVLSQ